MAARPTYIANSAGWTTSVRVKEGARASSPRTTAATENPVCGASASSQAVTASRNASFCSHSDRPIPHHWAPWPGKTNATRPRSAAVPVTTAPWLSSAASARRPATASSVVPAITTPRAGCCVRVVASEWATSDRLAPVDRPRWFASRAALRARACGPVPDTVRQTGPSACGAVGTGALPGASPRATCALVPPYPKLLTPANRGPAGHAVASVTTSRRSAEKSMRGFGVRKWRLGGMTPWCTASAALTSPSTPAAGSRWPKFVFTEPMRSGAGRSGPNTVPSAPASVTSPRGVPVPCASTYDTACGATPAFSHAARSTSVCASWPGAVSPSVAPSLLTALPCTSA
ncbi:hypothetical protein SGRI78S_06053 [Streptomyces griseus subsp. griseus]